MKHRLPQLAGLVLVVAGACGGGTPIAPTSSPTPSPSSTPTTSIIPGSSPIPSPAASSPLVPTASPSPSPSPTHAPVPSSPPSPSLNLPQLKIVLIAAYGLLWYCDPDFYPIARDNEIDRALARWSEVVADKQAFAALLAARGLSSGTAFSDAQKLEIYHEWKILNAIALDPTGNGSYRFDYLAEPKGGAAEGTRTGGTIAATGKITVVQQTAAGAPMCPICLARGTRIETPAGGVPVDQLRIGDPVWTLDNAGRRIPATVLAIGSTPAPVNHQVVHLVLADGRFVTASPGHPLADGRLLGDLRPGDFVDGSAVVSANRNPYTGGETFDLVVSGPTGVYLVDGIALASTLR